MTRQFFESSGHQGNFKEKFLDMVRSLSFFVRPGGVTQIHTDQRTYIRVNKGISLIGCPPHGGLKIRYAHGERAYQISGL